MDKQDKIILEGVFQEFDPVNRNPHQDYARDGFWEKYLRKIKLENRNKKMKQIINKIK